MKNYLLFWLIPAFLMNTLTGNAQWYKIYETNKQMRGIQFLNNDTGFICGAYEGAKLMKTVTGGYTWQDITGSFTSQIYSVYFIDNEKGFVYTTKNGVTGIYKTTNGGATWSLCYNSPPYIWSFYFQSPETGYAFPSVMEYAYCVKTTDGGNTWNQIASISLPMGGTGIWDSHFPTPERGYFVTDEGSVYRTNNSGATWTSVYHANYYSLHGVFFTTADTGYVTGSSACGQSCGLLLRTTNGGASWTPSNFPYRCYDVFFTTHDTGYIASDRILKTTDRGITWIPEETDYNSIITQLSFPSHNIGFGISLFGTVLKRDPNAVVGVNHPLVYNPMKVYPVPAMDEVSFSFYVPSQQDVTIELVNGNGATVGHLFSVRLNPGQQTINANLAQYPPGIYYARLILRESALFAKVVIAH